MPKVPGHRARPVFNSGIMIATAIAFLISATGAIARAAEPQCDAAARFAARNTDVPVKILKAITRVETGRTTERGFAPWPWTVNIEGRGTWFDTSDRALAFVFDHFQSGARNFDLGCFQVNYRWHHTGFASIEDMLDPQLNALYAARFLERLHGEFGNWDEAVRAYHSRTPAQAKRYYDRFREVLAKLTTADELGGKKRRTPGGAALSFSPETELRTRASGSLFPMVANAQSRPLGLFASQSED